MDFTSVSTVVPEKANDTALTTECVQFTYSLPYRFTAALSEFGSIRMKTVRIKPATMSNVPALSLVVK